MKYRRRKTTLRLLLFALPFLAPQAEAQTTQPVKLLHYALDSFSTGKVLMKSGEASVQTLNYNLLTNEMVFMRGSDFLAIARPQDVDTVFIQNRKFVPVANRFYEWLAGKEPALFLDYTCTVKEPGTETGFGKTTTGAASSPKSLISSGGAYQLKLPDDFTVVPSTVYWIKKEGKFEKVSNAGGVAKLYPAKASVVEAWMKDKKNRFSNREDLAALINTMQ